MRNAIRVATLWSAALFLAVIATAQSPSIPGPDLDRDGINDDLEQALLEKFYPTFMITSGDCDGLPSEFIPGSRKAVPLERNGTIYGQVFLPAVGLAEGRESGSISPGVALEIHYYHLWAKDCGRRSHALDPEHIAVLIRARIITSDASQWQAVYWYAAAHENTVCDRSSIAPAASLAAVDKGATVWISLGKHAAYLSRADCDGGCGGDRCVPSAPMPRGKLINLGELGAPLNGAVWTESPQWTLSAKMQTSFDQGRIAETRDLSAEITSESGGGKALAGKPSPSLQAAISAGGSSLDGVAVGQRKTSSALAVGAEKTDHALGSSDGKVRGSLSKAHRAVMRFLGGKPREVSTPPEPPK